MSNWIRNTIKANNIQTLNIFTNNQIDFNKIIPEPKSKDDCPSEFLAENSDMSHIMPSENKPWYNWYAWRCAKWGTGCNADTDTDDISTDDTLVTFDTKDSTAFPIVAAISKQLKDTRVEHSCLDIDQLYAPIMKTVWLNGKMIEAYESVFEDDIFPFAENDGDYSSFTPIDVLTKYNID